MDSRNKLLDILVDGRNRSLRYSWDRELADKKKLDTQQRLYLHKFFFYLPSKMEVWMDGVLD